MRLRDRSRTDDAAGGGWRPSRAAGGSEGNTGGVCEDSRADPATCRRPPSGRGGFLKSLFLATAAVLLALAAPALAAAPANDARAAATAITPPGSVSGTVTEATLEDNELPSDCGDTDASVWYRFTPPKRGSVVVQLDAGGNLDASVDVYERSRSELTSVDCAASNSKGSATLGLDGLDPAHEYLVRVGKLRSSDPGDFKLQVLVPNPPATAPGRVLPRRGISDSVDRLINPSDAYNLRLREGVAYRVDLAKQGCLPLAIYAPGTSDFDAAPERTLRCGGYHLFTPDRNGRYVLLVQSGRRRGDEPYRLRVGRARADDTTPGLFIHNYARVHGRVNGRIDSVDLYRFDVVRRSALTLRVSGNPEVELLGEHGRRIDSGSDIRIGIRPGRYYAAVRGAGRYTLRRVSRAITHASTSFSRASAPPGTTVSLSLNVRPGVEGRGVIVVQRLDPIAGYQFLRRYHVRVVGGRATVAFTPPSVGHYRASSSFLGSRTASPSATGYARLTVNGPLVE
jgi:hypothetical protein